MSCIIRISGESLDADALLAQSTLEADGGACCPRLWRGLGKETASVFCHLPTDVVQLAARSHLAVEFSVYACSAEDEE